MKSTVIDTGERFIIDHQGQESYLSYRLQGQVLDFYNAFVPGPLRGKGYAKDLILYGMHYAVRNGLRVQPSHPAVVRFIQLNREWEYLSVSKLN
ncbi:MAG: GNAT family N-acetyltransferase [Lentimicrobiaceae bacterium]|jgi:predicted GNAT family acetyltransferase|nr:GNAT family N-acetyltransferase [Lentimicrobiaceae bacterium]